MKNNKLVTKIHLVIASFFLPASFAFFITGGLYTWGIKGSSKLISHEINLSEPMSANLSYLSLIVENEVNRRNLEYPTGKSRLKKVGTSYQFEWLGSKNDIILKPTSDPLKAKLEIKENSLYRQIVQLHKAKGGLIFKVFSASLVIGLFLLFATGLLLAWKSTKMRKLTQLSMGFGAAIFVMVFILS